MQVSRREAGVATLFALALMVVVMGVVALMFARTLGEVKHSGDDAGIVQSLLLARGAANMGGAILQGPVQEALRPIVTASSSTAGQWSFGSGAFGGSTPTPQSVAAALNGGSGSVAAQLQPQVDALLCTDANPPQPRRIAGSANAWATVRIYLTDRACGQPLPSGASLPAAHFVQGSPRTGSDTTLPQQYALPFVLVAEGHVGAYKRNVVVQGEYEFVVGRPSFAKYALFTNYHQTKSGSDVWFTHDTLFDGPVHTNQYFRFHSDPWFGGAVTSAGCSTPGPGCTVDRPGAQFYGNRHFTTNPGQHPVIKNKYGKQAPVFTAGVNWQSGYVPLPVNSQDQKSAAQSAGLYLNGTPSTIRLWAGGADGQPLTRQRDGAWGPAAGYQYIEVCDTSASSGGNSGWSWSPRTQGIGGGWGNGGDWGHGDGHGGGHDGGGSSGGGAGSGAGGGCTTYRYQEGGALQTSDGQGGWTTAASDFNGVVYVDGGIDSLSGPARTGQDTSTADSAPPALASFAQLTVASAGTMTITGDLTYEDPPCTGELQRTRKGVDHASCNDMGAKNVLGLYSQQGDVLIGHGNGSRYNPSALDAPQDLRIDGVLMSATGVVGVQNHDRGDQLGSVHLLGGVIENNYGAFGTFDAVSGAELTGYARKFTYDPRMAAGLAPPHFPTVGGDAVKDVVLFSYGQREQVY